MRFEITVHKEMGNKRKTLYRQEVEANDGIQAIELSGVRFRPGKVVEIRVLGGLTEAKINRPAVSRVERDGVI